MNTSAVPTASPAWKQEVNRRLAEHKGRKPAALSEPQAHAEAQTSASRRALEAAARVAARYANAPSYSEMLANEARAALRAADAASEAAQQARAAAQNVLDGIEAAVAAAAAPAPQLVAAPSAPKPRPALAQAVPAPFEPARKPAPVAAPPAHEPAAIAIAEPESEPPSASVRWAPEFPTRPAEPRQARPNRGDSLFDEEWWKPASAEPLGPGAGEIEVVEPAQPIYGNLIEFPSELVATRKVRPRLAEGPASGAGAQLSIFEVDPGTLSPPPAAEPVEAASPAWTAPQWSGIELEAHPRDLFDEILEEPSPAPVREPAIEPAVASRRLLAIAFDAAMVTAALIGWAALALRDASAVPSMRTAEMAAAAGLLIAAALYHVLFFTLARATPGMKYAQIRLCTFDGHVPTRAQRCARLVAMLLSVLPLGLGILWPIFDDGHLSWHDRLSRTYLRRA